MWRLPIMTFAALSLVSAQEVFCVVLSCLVLSCLVLAAVDCWLLIYNDVLCGAVLYCRLLCFLPFLCLVFMSCLPPHPDGLASGKWCDFTLDWHCLLFCLVASCHGLPFLFALIVCLSYLVFLVLPLASSTQSLAL